MPKLNTRIFLFLFILASHFSFGQVSLSKRDNTSVSQLWYGVKVNGNVPLRKKLPADSLSGVMKPGAGLFIAYNATPWLRPQLEIEYSTLTFKKITDERITTSYLDFGFNLFVKPGYRTNMNLVFGVQACLTTGTTFSSLNGSSVGGLTKEYKNVSNGRLDYLLSTGLTLPASDKVDLFAKYSYSLTDRDVPNKILGKSSYWQVGVAVNLNKFLEETTKPSPEQVERDKNNRALMDGGVLLVRLNYPRNAIKRFMEAGDIAGANGLRMEADEFNKQLIQSFKKHYKFTPVYFFIDDKSQKILDLDFDSLFVNENLQIDTTIKCTSRKFLIAEIGYVELIYGNTLDNMMVVLSPKFEQMKSPFPYSAYNLKPLESKKKYFKGMDPESLSVFDRNVMLLDQRLVKFYYEYYDYSKK